MKPRPPVLLRFVTFLVNRQKAVVVKSSYSECCWMQQFDKHSVFLTTAERLGTNLTEFWISSSVTSTTEQWSSSRGRGSAPPWVTHGSIWKDVDSSEIGHFHNLTPRGPQKMHSSKYSQFTSLCPSNDWMANASFSTFTGKVCFKLGSLITSVILQEPTW